MLNIGILTVATGKYFHFIKNLYNSINTNFLVNHKRIFIIFTDQVEEAEKLKDETGFEILIFKIERKGFPGDTLYRYHYFCQAYSTLLNYTHKPDVLFYFDADMLVSATVEEEVLPENGLNLVAVAHPGYYNQSLGTPETNPRSTAYLPANRYRPCYWAGGFNGGAFSDFMQMSFDIKERVDEDDKNNIIAIWHDESHLNAYLSERWQNKVKTLIPSYCYPENWNMPFENKITALEKNHKEIRG